MPSAQPLHPVALLPEEWSARLAKEGERPFRALEVFRWIHKRGALAPDRMTSLPKLLRERVFEGAKTVGNVVDARRSEDDTRKLVIELEGGARIETVLIPRVSGYGKFRGGLPGADDEGDADVAAAPDDDDDDDAPGAARPGDGSHARAPAIRVTQCISTQVGCAMGCVFCASGVAGLKRHLGPEEIVGQILLAKDHLDPGEEIRNVVFMGMGEPLHNYDATKRSLDLMTHDEGLSLSTRRVTVSTSGLIPEIDKLGADFGGAIGLAISLHAADDASRGALMPINKKYPLSELMSCLRRYPLPKRRRITIEYTLVLGHNDSVDEAKKLARLLRGIPVKINLIPMNPIEASELGPPSAARVEEFQSVLCEAGYSCFVRRRRGDDVAAACGQLALAGAAPKITSARRLLRKAT